MKTIILFLMMVVSRFAFAQANPMESFNFNGVKLGDTTQQLQSFLPTAEVVERISKPEIGLYTYIATDIGSVDAAIFYVYNNHIYKIRLGYFARTIEALGGWEPIIDRMVQKYGKFDPKSPGTSTTDGRLAEFLWTFPGLNKYIGVVVDKESVLIDFVDDASTKQMQKSLNSQMGF